MSDSIFDVIDRRFMSGNSVSVERVHIKSDEWTDLKYELFAAREENERLRKANQDCAAWEKACKADLDRALARVAELEGYEPSQLFSAFRMRFQAKALEERVAYIEQKARAKSLGDAAIISHLKQYATRLRQQADQLEKAGGSE